MGIEEGSAGRIGTLHRDRLRDEFVVKMLDITGDVKLFALAQSGDTTTTTTKDKGARVISRDMAIATAVTSASSTC